eukprot:INCI18643.1.p1 GENE.INCI18643.1~~INCI18643.1.p1  ORF type:complete len:598 (+),score=120.47 INCI18643.1:293-2086(+)
MSGCPFAAQQPTKSLDNAVETAIRESVVNFKVNACPMAVRLAWHASGTFDKETGVGGSDGATMRFEPEATDGANAGLNIMRDLLKPVKDKFPFVSKADIWARAGAFAVKMAGGPDVPFRYGRSDAADASACPPNGNLPDATQGAQHLRDVFYRMGFNDREIVCLSGAHTLGSCHKSRSGFDGPWTANPLKFDNTYFTFLMDKEWTPRKWDGPLQYEDPSGKYMMLPTDLALKEDPEFNKFARMYADDEQLFFNDFSAAFAKLMSLGCPAHAQAGPDAPAATSSPAADTDVNHDFREYAMHGSLERMQQIGEKADANSREPLTGRTALHKAAFWGHDHVIDYLINARGVDVNAQDMAGSTALHDASQFGHAKCIELLVAAGAEPTLKDKAGRTVAEVAAAYGKSAVVEQHVSKRARLDGPGIRATCEVAPGGKPCHGGSDAGNNCSGTVQFTQAEVDGPVEVQYEITGLTPGLHGFHIHEKADFSNGCASAGGHWNPHGKTHGDLADAPNCHAGDLGNIVADESGRAAGRLVAPLLRLSGELSIVGRSVMVHADPDDLGKGDCSEPGVNGKTSHTTGNAGARVGCGEIVLVAAAGGSK